jgi:hypothetical protein
LVDPLSLGPTATDSSLLTCGEPPLTLPLRPVGSGPVSLGLGCYVCFDDRVIES